MPGGGREDINRGPRPRGRFVSSLEDKSVLVLSAVTVLGITLVGVGWVIQGSAYVPGLLMQLGASMMLLVPLAVLGLMLEGRMRRTEEQVRATAARLDTLTAVTRQRLAENQRQRDELYDVARRDPAAERIRLLLDDALNVGAVAQAGPRVGVPGTSVRLRFHPDGNGLSVQVEEREGTPLERLMWNAGERADMFSRRLAERLRALNRYPGDRAFEPSAVLQRLLEVVRLGVDARTGEMPHDLGHIIEIPNQQWAISAEGLFSLSPHYHISTQRIVESHENWPRYMRGLAWVDPAAFDEAYELARYLLRPGEGN